MPVVRRSTSSCSFALRTSRASGRPIGDPRSSRNTGRVIDSPLPPSNDRTSPLRRYPRELSALDHRLYAAVAGARRRCSTRFFRRLSRTADKSVLWLGVAGVMAAVGGAHRATGGHQRRRIDRPGLGHREPRRQAVTDRRRPDRLGAEVPDAARADAHLDVVPVGSLRLGLRLRRGGQHGRTGARACPCGSLAVAVAYSRVHIGVHYPGDVVGGALIGMTSGEVACRVLSVARRRWDIP